MISLRKLWSAESPSDDNELLRVIYLLLHGIALHAVDGDTDDHEKFRADMHSLLSIAEADPSPSNLLVTTGSALKTLEDYNQRTTRYLRMQGAELQNMIGMLTRTIASLGTGSELSVTRLEEIEGLLEKASVIQDVRMLKTRMEDCLKSIREESQRQKTDSAGTLESLKHEILQTQERIRAVSAPLLDPVTGLQTRVEAEVAFVAAAKSPTPAYAVLFAVDRVAAINTRFGYAVGDRLLNLYLEELQGRFLAPDRIFRWSGPGFVALIQRPDRLEKVRDQLRSVVPPKTDKTIQFPNRTVLLPISATWTVFQVTTPVLGLVEQLDKFLATQWQQG